LLYAFSVFELLLLFHKKEKGKFPHQLFTRAPRGQESNAMADAEAKKMEEKAEEKKDVPKEDRSKGSMPDPTSLLPKTGEKKPLPEVEQMGTITVETLNAYDCNNPDRRLISLFGQVFDVSEADKKYGPDGAYSEFAGHDITLTMGAGQMGDKWLDKFIKMDEAWKKGAENWVDYYEELYPKCGKLDKWDEDPDTWPEPTPEEREALNAQCIIL
jgi:predicted heme/steroid binding protein